MKVKIILLTLLILPALSQAENCESILKLPAHTYINKYSAQHGDTTIAQVDAINTYKQCYQQQIDVLKNQLATSGQGPLMGAQGNFRDMQAALTQFTNYALKITATGGTYDQIQFAYAKLYGLQFENAFYQSYQSTNHINASKNQLDKIQEIFHQELTRFTQDEQDQLEHYFDRFETALTQGLNLPAYMAYVYAASILQSPASSTLINPVF